MLICGRSASVRVTRRNLSVFVPDDAVDLLRKSGEFPMSYREFEDAAATVYEGI